MKSQYKLFHQEPRSRPLYTVKERKSDCVLIISTYPHIDALHQLSRSRNIRIRIHSGKHIYYSNSTTSATNNYNVFLCTVTILTSSFFFFFLQKTWVSNTFAPFIESINIIIITWKAIPIDKQQSMALLRISSRYVFLLYFFTSNTWQLLLYLYISSRK